MGEVWAIVVAGGSGSRFSDAAPKQFLELAGLRLIDWALAAAGAACDGVVAVLAGHGDPGRDERERRASSDVELRTLGFYGQQEIGFRDRLFLTGAVRYDASSTFAPACS